MHFKNSGLSQDARNPVLLPKCHQLTNLYIERALRLALRCGGGGIYPPIIPDGTAKSLPYAVLQVPVGNP